MLHLSLLGTFTASYGGVVLGPIGSLRARNLLIYLVLNPERAHARAALAAFLWPDLPEAKGIASVRQALYVLQRWLRSGPAAPDLFQTSHLNVAVQREHVQCDALLLADIVEQVTRHQHRNVAACATCAAQLQQATELYRGDLVHGVSMGGTSTDQFELWLHQQRERLRLSTCRAFAWLTAYQQRHQRYDAMIESVRSWLTLDPWHEPAQRSLMLALAASGRRSAALRQYEAFRVLIDRELGLAPDSQTTYLAASIRAGEIRLIPHRFSISRQRIHLIGRDDDQHQLIDLLSAGMTRLVTIVGIGGVGKTSLATVVAHRSEPSFASGAAFVELDGRTERPAMLAALAEAVDCPLTAPSDPLEQLMTALAGCELLLLLDGLEVNDAALLLIAQLLSRLPQLTLLVTAQRRLRLTNELVFELPGLAFPPLHSEQLTEFAAVQLFMQRANQYRFGGQWAAEIADIAAICRLVDGLPLAIELAAQQVRLRSCAAIVATLQASLTSLESTLHDALPRHRSFEQLFDQMLQQLSPPQRTVLLALSLFHTPFSEQDVVDVVDELVEPLTVTSILTDFADRTLVQSAGSGRLALHALLRQFVLRRSEHQSTTRQALHERCRRLFLGRLQAANLTAITAHSLQSARRLAGRFDDVHAALLDAFAIGADDEVATAAVLYATFARVNGRAADAAAALAAAGRDPATALLPATCLLLLTLAASLFAGLEQLDAAEDALTCVSGRLTATASPIVPAVGAITESLIHSRRGRHAASLTAAHRVLTLATDPLIPWVPIEAHLMIGRAAMMARDYLLARQHLATAVDLAHSSNDMSSLFSTLNESAQLAIVTDRLAEAVPLLEQALLIARSIANPVTVSVACSNLGPLLVLTDIAPDRGLALIHEAVALAVTSDRALHICDRYHSLAFALTHLQRYEHAIDALHHTLPLINEQVPPPLLLQLLETAGSIFIARSQREQAAVALTQVAFHPACHPYYRNRAVNALRRLPAQALVAGPATPALYRLTRDLLLLLSTTNAR
jgi:DNA-binding SARP family transcriptional activator/predicted ATPase